MDEVAWEQFDQLCRTLYRYGRRIVELEQRLAALEARLDERPRVLNVPVHTNHPVTEIQ